MAIVNQNSLILVCIEVHHQRYVHHEMPDDIWLGRKISGKVAHPETTLPELLMKWVAGVEENGLYK